MLDTQTMIPRNGASPVMIPHGTRACAPQNKGRREDCMLRLFKILAATLLVAASFAGPSQAAFPERPITLIVPWAAGGGTDAIARMIGAMLEKEVGQPVNVVNRTGGNGV